MPVGVYVRTEEHKRKLRENHKGNLGKKFSEENLIPLCTSCHMQTGFNREDWTKYFQERIIK